MAYLIASLFMGCVIFLTAALNEDSLFSRETQQALLLAETVFYVVIIMVIYFLTGEVIDDGSVIY